MDAVNKKRFKMLAHALNPVVMIGQAGFTQAVLNEIHNALDVHELIKVKIRAERDERVSIAKQICDETKAELVQAIGQIIVIYRENPKKK